MKYVGMPFGMWTLFAPSFRKQLTAVFGYDADTACGFEGRVGGFDAGAGARLGVGGAAGGFGGCLGGGGSAGGLLLAGHGGS